MSSGVRGVLGGGGSAFRPGVEGLRAVAIGLVLLVHAGVPLVPAGFVGVDVFFVISGFLITGLLVRELEVSGRIDLAAFWARRVRRLLPAALVVFVVTAVVSWLVAPSSVWRDTGWDLVSAALYVSNWRFAVQEVDYNAVGTDQLPLQHFWSLSVEEQFYVLIPVLLAVVALLVWRRRGAVSGTSAGRYGAAPAGVGGGPRGVRLVAFVVLGLVTAVSLWWSVVSTPVTPESSYFVTTTRLWELGVGGLLAVGAVWLQRVPVWCATVLAWLGVVAVVASAVVFDAATPWPGWQALVPTLGTAAVLVAIQAGATSWWSPAGWLGWRPLVWIGGLSYSLYLWHWPVLKFAEYQFGELRIRYALIAVLVAGILAWLSLKFVENPVRYAKRFVRSKGLSLSMGANLTAVGVVAGLVLVVSVPAASTTAVSQVDLSDKGANVLELGERGEVLPYDAPTVAPETLTPAPENANNDIPPAELEECSATTQAEFVTTCSYGLIGSDTVIALVGNSKAMQWQAGLAALAEQNGWEVRTYTKNSCSFAWPTGESKSLRVESCNKWNEKVIDLLLAEPPNAVVTTGSVVLSSGSVPASLNEAIDRTARSYQALSDAGIPVVVLLDNPEPDQEIPDCVAANLNQLEVCSFGLQPGLDRSGQAIQLGAAERAGIDTVVDLTDAICLTSSDTCPAVIGDVLLYRQGSHLTNTYVLTLVRVMSNRLVPVIEEAIK